MCGRDWAEQVVGLHVLLQPPLLLLQEEEGGLVHRINLVIKSVYGSLEYNCRANQPAHAL